MRDQLQRAGKALKSLWSQCSSFRRCAVEYIDAMIDHVVKASQKNDDALNGFDWKDNPAKDFGSNPACFSSANWKKTYAAADKEGFCNSKAKDGGMEKALAAWEQHPLAKDPKSVDAKDLTKKRKEATKLLAQVAKAAEKLAAANPDSHTEFLKYLAFLRRTAHGKIADFQREQDETNFNSVLGTDVDSWKRTYEAGVAASAIPKDEKAFKELEKPLTSFAKAFEKMTKAKAGQETQGGLRRGAEGQVRSRRSSQSAQSRCRHRGLDQQSAGQVLRLRPRSDPK